MNRLSPTARAAVMMTVCCAFIAASTFFAKVLGRGMEGAPMHALQIGFGRYLFALMALTPFAVWTRMSFRAVPLPLYLGRATSGYIGVSLMFAAAALMPLADATAISFLNPVIAMVLAVFVLKETVGPIRWTAAAIALAGGALLIRPGFGVMRPEALVALAAALFIAWELIFAKLLARREGVVRMLVMTNSIAVCIGAVASSFVWRWPSPAEWGVMALVGVTMVTAQALFMATLRTADASFATPFFYATLVFAAAYDALWFGEIPDALSIAGSALIVAGAVVMAVREARAAKGVDPAPLDRV